MISTTCWRCFSDRCWALDECPSTTGIPSAREEILDSVEDLVGSRHPNPFLCITSRPKQDLQTAPNPLTTTGRCVPLHEEHGKTPHLLFCARRQIYAEK